MKPTQEAGFGVLEVLAALLIAVIGVLAFVGSIAKTSAIARDTLLNDQATAAIRNVMEEMREADFAGLKLLYEPGGEREEFWVGADGAVIYVEPDDVVGHGTIAIHTDESAIPAGFADFGGECDLNRDGDIDGDVSDYKMLPVRVSLDLGSEESARTIALDVLLAAP